MESNRPKPSRRDKKDGKQLLGIGLFLLVLTLTIVFTLDFNKLIQYHVVILILSLSSAMIISQIPDVVFDLKLPIGVNAAGSIGFSTLIFYLFYTKTDEYFPPAQIPSNIPVELSSNSDNCTYPKVKISILCSDNDDYNRVILIHLLNALEAKLPAKHRKCLNFIVRYGSGVPFDSTSKQNYFSLIESAYHKDTDYHVAIGTGASIAYKTYLREKNLLRNSKFVFLGVTDPIGSGLVNSLTDRNEGTEIAGVAYCGNFERLPLKVQELYPDDKMIFIYNKAYLQDKQLADEIKNLPLVAEGKLKIKELDRQPLLSDFSENAVYFSWETVEHMFKNQSYEIIYKIDKLVSSTATQVEQGLVPFAVTTSDQTIGREGAKIISQNLDGKKLKSMDIFIPKWEVYANCKKALDRKIPKTLIRIANTKFDDEDCE